MTTLSRRLRLLTIVTAALACSSTTEPTGTVTAVGTAEGIRATNGTSRPVFYSAVEREVLARLNSSMVPPCTDAARCASIAPGASITMPWSQVSFFDPAKHDYLFGWWQAPVPARMDSWWQGPVQIDGQALSGYVEVHW